MSSVHAVASLRRIPWIIARALDVVRRMGFDLVSVWARPTPSHSFLVHVNFVPLGELPPRVLADRISAFVGVSGVELQIE